MELKLTENKEQVRVLNFEELKSELEAKLKPYTDYVVTEELLPQAKKDIAELNKVKKLINDERIRIERELLEPLNIQVKELTALIDSSTKTIKTQVDNFEEERKDNKRKEIQAVFDEYNDIGLDIVKIWNDKWLNKGFTIKNIETEIKDRLATIKNNISMIDKLNYTDEEKHTILVSYLFNLDLDLSIKQFEDGKANYQKMIESQNEPLQAEKQETSTITLDTPQTSVEHAKTSVKVYSSVMRFTDNVENMKKLKKFLDETGISYEIIENMKEVK